MMKETSARRREPATFARYLREVEARLDVPYPARRELIDEIAGHLESLHQSLIEEGMDVESAGDEAIRRLALDEELLASMDEVHLPTVRRALAYLPAPVSLVLEHLGVGLLVTAALVAILAKEEGMLDFLSSGGFFMIPLNVMGLAILILAGERTFSLYIKKDHRAGNLRRRLLSLRFLAQACAMVGVIGTLLGFFHAFSASARLEEIHGAFPIWEVSRVAITTTIWGLTLALIALVVSYVVQSKAARIEESSVPDVPSCR